jgi:hypothetical protein
MSCNAWSDGRWQRAWQAPGIVWFDGLSAHEWRATDRLSSLHRLHQVGVSLHTCFMSNHDAHPAMLCAVAVACWWFVY